MFSFRTWKDNHEPISFFHNIIIYTTLDRTLINKKLRYFIIISTFSCCFCFCFVLTCLFCTLIVVLCLSVCLFVCCDQGLVWVLELLKFKWSVRPVQPWQPSFVPWGLEDLKCTSRFCWVQMMMTYLKVIKSRSLGDNGFRKFVVLLVMLGLTSSKSVRKVEGLILMYAMHFSSSFKTSSKRWWYSPNLSLFRNMWWTQYRWRWAL